MTGHKTDSEREIEREREREKSDVYNENRSSRRAGVLFCGFLDVPVAASARVSPIRRTSISSGHRVSAESSSALFLRNDAAASSFFLCARRFSLCAAGRRRRPRRNGSGD